MSGVRGEESNKYKATKTKLQKAESLLPSPPLPSPSVRPRPSLSSHRIVFCFSVSLQILVDINVVSLWFLASVEVDAGSCRAKVVLFGICLPALEEHVSLTSHNVAASAFTAGLLVELNLNTSTPDTFRPPPAPLPYDVVLGCPQSPDSESVREIISCSSFETLATCEDLEELDCKTHASSFLFSPRKSDLTKLHEPVASATEEDACPICLEVVVAPFLIGDKCCFQFMFLQFFWIHRKYDFKNPKHITKCEHHFHLSCILEWMERSDICPICDQEVIIDHTYN
ncbi:hypothetical protein POTOM_010499 [Populus tomentosa]|uniref:RING-type E3 ubiquitin transferase n=1 Tax=Populus tomentosa TaxID=118781 RepID=A0A8X8DAT0_POPTO|nr:hypothetical protein POTOM_010499 [Populus tomentosa]